MPEKTTQALALYEPPPTVPFPKEPRDALPETKALSTASFAPSRSHTQKKGQAAAPFYSLSGLCHSPGHETPFTAPVEPPLGTPKGAHGCEIHQVAKELAFRRPQAWKS